MKKFLRISLSILFYLAGEVVVEKAWGQSFGNHFTGVRSLVAVDYSRSTANQLNYKGEENVLASPFMLTIQLWYPAEGKTASHTQPLPYVDVVLMSEDDFMDLSIAEKKQRLKERMSGYDSTDIHFMLNHLKTHARLNAQPKEGTFPLVISYSTNIAFNEFIASHGYVVAFIQSTLSDRTHSLNDRGWEFNEILENISLTRNFVSQALPGIVISKTALAGFSYYGAMMQLAQMRSAAYDAVISLDGTEAWAGYAANLSASQYFRPELARTPILRLHNEEHPGLNWSLFYDKAIHSDRWILSMKGIDHGFIQASDLELKLSALHGKDLPDVKKQQHAFMWTSAVHFLNYYLLDDANSKVWMEAQTRKQVDGTSLQFTPASKIQPPSNAELKKLIEESGVNGLRELFRELSYNPALLSVSVLYNVAYEYRFSNAALSQDLLKLAREFHPQSSLACLYLAMHYARHGERMLAIQLAEEGIKLYQSSATPDLSKAQADQLQVLLESWKRS